MQKILEEKRNNTMIRHYYNKYFSIFLSGFFVSRKQRFLTKYLAQGKHKNKNNLNVFSRSDNRDFE